MEVILWPPYGIMVSSWHHHGIMGSQRGRIGAANEQEDYCNKKFLRASKERESNFLSLSLYIYIYIHNSEFRYCYAIIATVTTCFIAHRTCVNELADAGVQLAVVRIYLLGSYGYVGVLNIVCAVRDALLADVDIALPALPAAGFMSSL